MPAKLIACRDAIGYVEWLTGESKFCHLPPVRFSAASEVAFGHALKIALQAQAKLDIMHVETHLSAEEPYWLEFPAVRATLARWGVLPKGARPDEVVRYRWSRNFPIVKL